mgnify:CR=1 FL=1
MSRKETFNEHEVSDKALSKILGGVASGSTGCFGFSNCCNDTCQHEEDGKSKKKKPSKETEDECDNCN